MKVIFKNTNLIFEKYGRCFGSTGIKRILTNYKYKGYYCGRKSTEEIRLHLPEQFL